jgi:hypothetical protein
MLDRCDVGRLEAVLTDERCSAVLGEMYDKTRPACRFDLGSMWRSSRTLGLFQLTRLGHVF